MGIYHLCVKAISRSSGRSATAAAAYRACEKIHDDRTGITHDFTRKRGLYSADLLLPEDAPHMTRSQLWNSAELAERRKDSCTAREVEIALPHELTNDQRRALALRFARSMVETEKCAVDVCIHAPGKDSNNWHAHMLRTTRQVTPEGLGSKLDTEKAGRKRADDLEALRERWATMANEALREVGQAATLDHRTLAAQGINRTPQVHLGPTAAAMQRKGKETDRGAKQMDSQTTQKMVDELRQELEETSQHASRLEGLIGGDPVARARDLRDRIERIRKESIQKARDLIDQAEKHLPNAIPARDKAAREAARKKADAACKAAQQEAQAAARQLKEVEATMHRARWWQVIQKLRLDREHHEAIQAQIAAEKRARESMAALAASTREAARPVIELCISVAEDAHQKIKMGEAQIEELKEALAQVEPLAKQAKEQFDTELERQRQEQAKQEAEVARVSYEQSLATSRAFRASKKAKEPRKGKEPGEDHTPGG